MKFAIWVGIAVLAIIVAAVHQWHARRVLNQIQQTRNVTDIRVGQAPAHELTRSAAAS